MGGLISCCISDGHCACCSVISLVGAIFYLVFFITVALQPQFLNINISDEAGTKGACLLAFGFYLLCFVGTVFVQIKRRKRLVRPASTSYRQFADQEALQKRGSLLTEG